jgi:hypothetical protein
MSVDLRTCKKGDILISKHGERLTYVRPLPLENYFDHEVKYSNGAIGTRTDDGFVYRNVRLETDHDIVEIIHIENENNN